MSNTWKTASRNLNRRLPVERRVKGLGGIHGRRRLQARKLVHPLLPIDLTLTDSRGVRFVATSDPVDERVIDDLTGKRRQMWLPPGDEPVDLVLDVGAHHGHYVAAAAEHYPNAQIIAVEPAATGIDLVNRHAQLNNIVDRVEVVAAAIGSTAGSGTLHHDPAGSWGSSMHELQTDVTEKVAISTLAEILGHRKPDIVKSNSEGGEYDLVPQILELGLQPSLMVLMVHPEFGDAEALLSQLKGEGFSLESVGTEHRPAYHVKPRR